MVKNRNRWAENVSFYWLATRSTKLKSASEGRQRSRVSEITGKLDFANHVGAVLIKPISECSTRPDVDILAEE
jgi:hypothetical protein